MNLPPADRSSMQASVVSVQLSELISLKSMACRLRYPMPRRAISTLSAKPAVLHVDSQGLECIGSRPYQSGDDIRSVDWRQTARRGALYTKQFTETHERPVHFLVDMGASMRFATRIAFKSVMAARAASYLVWQIAVSGERVGGQVWTGRARLVLNARSLAQGLMPLLQQFADASAEIPSSFGIDEPLNVVANKTGMAALIVVSDFAHMTAETLRLLQICARRTHLLMVHVHDPFEVNPPPGIYRLDNGHHVLTLDLTSGETRQAYVDQFSRRCAALQQVARANRASYLPLSTDADLSDALAGAGNRYIQGRYGNPRA